MSQVPLNWRATQSASFLTIWQKVLTLLPSGTAGNTQALFMCVAYEETRFANIVQKGWEPLAARYDSGATLSKHDTNNLPKVAVGFTQVQIKQSDKASVISDMGLDPETLLFSDVTGDMDMNIQLGLRYLYLRGIQGQVGGHPQRSTFLKEWPKSAAALRAALRAGSLIDVQNALNSAITIKTNRTPLSFTTYWDFMFPEDEQETLFADWMCAMA